MEFRIATGAQLVDLAKVQRALLAKDPAALVDINEATNMLRIATSLSAAELATAVARAGLATSPEGIFQLQSECCGGCGG